MNIHKKLMSIMNCLNEVEKEIPKLTSVGITSYNAEQIRNLSKKIKAIETTESFDLGISSALNNFAKVHENYSKDRKTAADVLIQMGNDFKNYLNGIKATVDCLMESNKTVSVSFEIPPYLRA